MWQILSSNEGALTGRVRPPTSKSHSMRALLFALCAQGPSKIKGLLASRDIDHMREIIKKLGAELLEGEDLTVIPPSTPLWNQENPLSLDCGNSGIAWRFMTGLCALRKGPTLLYGDNSLHMRRPLTPLIGALNQLGVSATRLGAECIQGPVILHGFASVTRAGLRAKAWCKEGLSLDVAGSLDSQPVSAATLLASLIRSKNFGDKRVILVKNPSEVPWLQLSCDWMRFMGIETSLQILDSDHLSITMQVPTSESLFGSWKGFELSIPIDMSSTSFLLAAAMITKSQITLKGLDLESVGLKRSSKQAVSLVDRQVDALFFSLAKSAGVIFKQLREGVLVDARQGYGPMGRVDLSGAIDLLPILSVVASFADDQPASDCFQSTTLFGIEGARLKECDRVEATLRELSQAGVKLHLQESGGQELEIFPSRRTQKWTMHGSYQDHRMAMAMAVRSLVTGGQVRDPGCFKKTYPCFVEEMQLLGVKIRDS